MRKRSDVARDKQAAIDAETIVGRMGGDGADAIAATAKVGRLLGEAAGASLRDLKPRTEAELGARLPVSALERYADFAPGDSIGITLGAELYSPVKYNTFTVGPFSATVVVRPGETGADAAMRCYRVLLELNEAEFQIAWGRQRTRLTEMNGK